MANISQEKSNRFLQYLAIVNQLVVKAFSAKTLAELKFIILNDTIHLIRYDRAILWSIGKNKPEVLGFSGQSKFKSSSEMVEKLSILVQNIPEAARPQQLTKNSYPSLPDVWTAIEGESADSLVLWFPIKVHDEMYGLWVEKWNIKPGEIPAQDALEICANFLTPAYGSALEKLVSRNFFKRLATPRTYLILGTALLLFLLLIRIPLRIVAPCEIVPEDPYLVTAPLEGIVEEITVKPGEMVKKGMTLFAYDKRAPMHELQMAEKQLSMVQSEVNRSMTLGASDKKSLTEFPILSSKLEKEKINLEYAKYQASLLNVKSPIDGVIILDNPEDWRGRPVKIGEKVLTISDPQRTKIRIWVPEHDNIPLNFQIPISIFLNINPIKSYEAKLIYIANEVTMSDKKIPSFIAEAEWITKPEDTKLGLTGSAILYGERVSLLYFILRKPWGTLRNYLGI